MYKLFSFLLYQEKGVSVVVNKIAYLVLHTDQFAHMKNFWQCCYGFLCDQPSAICILQGTLFLRR